MTSVDHKPEPSRPATTPSRNEPIPAADHGGDAPPPSYTRYTVEKGDTLSHIAKQFYGKAAQWQTIFDANRDQIEDPDLIQPGQVLRLPPAPATGTGNGNGNGH